MIKPRLLIIILFSCIFFPTISPAIPFSEIESLTSITFWERTGGTSPTAFTFALDSQQLLTRLSGNLVFNNNDFHGASTEYYDVFYSDADGSFNAAGAYLSIEGVWSLQFPRGGALNIAEMSLNFEDGQTEYANYVASYIALGDNAILESIPWAIDGDLQTATVLGNTFGLSDRLRLTLGFFSSSGLPGLEDDNGPILPPDPPDNPAPVPEPATLILLGTGLVGILGFKRKIRHR